MCTDKKGAMEVRSDGVTLGESVLQIGEEIHRSILMAPDPTKADWTKIRAMIAQLIQVFGPILMPLIVSWLTPKDKI